MQPTSYFRPSVLDLVPQLIKRVFFQLVWFITVLSVSLDRIWPGPAILCFFFVVHSMISATVRADFILAAIAVMMGLVIDTVFVQTGLLRFEMNQPWPGVAPVWILILWANFALTLNNGLGWLQGRYKTAAILGFFGGSLSYLFGIGLGAGELLVTPLMAFLIIGVCWSIATPLLLFTARELALRTQKP